jgi:XisH protein
MAKDKIHNIVKQVLINDGWTITHDPYIIETKDVDFEVDLGAEKILAAEKQGQKIAVEVKSFAATSFVYEFHRILGQMLNYTLGIEDFEPNRKLYLAVPQKIYEEYFHLDFVHKAIKRFKIKLLIFNDETEIIIKWKIK